MEALNQSPSMEQTLKAKSTMYGILMARQQIVNPFAHKTNNDVHNFLTMVPVNGYHINSTTAFPVV